MTEYEKMLKGKIYSPGDPETNKLAHEQHKLALEYNTLNDLDPKRKELIDKICELDNENKLKFISYIFCSYIIILFL